MASLLMACASGPDTDSGSPLDPLAELIRRSTDEEEIAAEPALPPGPDPAVFVGGEVARLDLILGEPALTRREGPNEFRRYDLDDCRIFAIVAPAGGLVQTVSTGPLVSGEDAPAFQRCTAGMTAP